MSSIGRPDPLRRWGAQRGARLTTHLQVLWGTPVPRSTPAQQRARAHGLERARATRRRQTADNWLRASRWMRACPVDGCTFEVSVKGEVAAKQAEHSARAHGRGPTPETLRTARREALNAVLACAPTRVVEGLAPYAAAFIVSGSPLAWARVLRALQGG